MNVNSIKGLKEYFAGFSNENERAFELGLTDLAKIEDDCNLESNLKSVIDSDVSENIKYCAFYCLAIRYRYNKDISEMKKLFSTYNNKFEHKDTYIHLFLLHKVDARIKFNYGDIDQALLDSEKHSNNAGFIHLFSDIVATSYEKEYLEKDDWRFQNYVDKAIVAVEKAITLDEEYAKYYSTWARLLLLRGDCKRDDYRVALKKINEAIEKEKPRTATYVERLNEYQYHRMRILLEMDTQSIKNKQNEIIKEIDSKIRKVDSEMEKMKGGILKSVEFIGFFAGIITLAIGSFQVASGQPFYNAVMLIVALFGSLLCVFSGFGIILHGFKKDRFLPNMCVFGFGLMVILTVVVLVWPQA